MVTFVLDSTSAEEPVRKLIDQLGADGVRICDASGRQIAVLRKTPDDEEQLYEDAIASALDCRDILDQRAARRDCLTTDELRERTGMKAVDAE